MVPFGGYTARPPAGPVPVGEDSPALWAPPPGPSRGQSPRVNPFGSVQFEVLAGIHAGAAALARRRYQQRGLGFGIGGTGDRFPGVTVLAREGARVWATMRLGLDSLSGLQADAHYRDEIDRLRGASRRIAEVTRLAIDAPCPPATLLMALFRAAIGYLRNQPPITDLVIEVNPRHARFYTQRFGFAQIGEERTCTRVNAPAVLLHRPLSAAELGLGLAA